MSLSGAVFSDDKKYRYYLYRRWDYNNPWIAFIGLNPSTANETEDDPTIRRVVSFAKKWGYGGVFMINLYSFVTPYPSNLEKDDNCALNTWYIEDVLAKSDKVICAWGNFKEANERSSEILQMIDEPYCLGVNKNGSPKHPLYIHGDTLPVKFTLNIK